MLKLAAFASGRGSNFIAIHKYLKDNDLPGEFVVLISDRMSPPVADVALHEGISFVHLNAKNFPSRDEYTARLLNELESRNVDWIILAGYLKMIPSGLVQQYRNHILNIHPALLPLFGGKGMYGEHVHEAVIESGMKVSGATVHIVDEQYDTGPIVMQETVPVYYDDTPATLAARILKVEHSIYPRTVELAVRDKIRVHGRRVEILP
jgi:phosphoribosylglycinamide formyltransferase-1